MSGSVVLQVAKDAFRSLIVVSFLQSRGGRQNDFDEQVKLLAKERYNVTLNPLEKVRSASEYFPPNLF